MRIALHIGYFQPSLIYFFIALWRSWISNLSGQDCLWEGGNRSSYFWHLEPNLKMPEIAHQSIFRWTFWQKKGVVSARRQKLTFSKVLCDFAASRRKIRFSLCNTIKSPFFQICDLGSNWRRWGGYICRALYHWQCTCLFIKIQNLEVNLIANRCLRWLKFVLPI